MINLAVINLKDIIKFLVKALIVIIVLIIMFNFVKIIRINRLKEFILNNSFVNSMNTEIAIANYNKENDEIRKVSILEQEFKLFGYVASKNKDKVQDIVYEEESSLPEISKNQKSTSENTFIKVDTEVIEENNIPAKVTDIYKDVNIKNESDYSLTDDILEPDYMPDNKKDILIFHTHTCESYTPTEQNNYEETGNYRTTDLDYSVARVGKELTDRMTDMRI